MKLCVNPHTRCYGFLQVYENTAIRACVCCVAFFYTSDACTTTFVFNLNVFYVCRSTRMCHHKC